MTIDEAIEVLELHNQWRKGSEIEMQTPVRIGMAIDLVVCELKNLRNPPVISSFCKCKGGAVGRTVTADFKHQICEKCGKLAK